MCWNSRWPPRIAFALHLARETRAYGHLCPIKRRGIVFLPPTILPSPSSHSSSPQREGKNCLSEQRERGRFDSNKSHLSNHLVLSPPDRREEWCVRAENGVFKSWLLVLTLLFPQCVTLLDLHVSNRSLPPPRDYVSVRNISVCCIISGVKGQRVVTAAKGTCHQAWPPGFSPQERRVA